MQIYHKHHIIPKHMGGSNEESNFVTLTIEEHAEAHKRLWEQHGAWQDLIAWKALSGQLTPIQAQKEAVKKALTGKKQSPEHVSKRTYKGIRRKPVSVERKRKVSEIHKSTGHRPTKDALYNAAQTNKGSFWITNGLISKKLRKNDDIPEGWKRGRIIRP